MEKKNLICSKLLISIFITDIFMSLMRYVFVLIQLCRIDRIIIYDKMCTGTVRVPRL